MTVGKYKYIHPGSIIFDLFLALFMCFLLLVIIFPFLNIISISLSSPGAILAGQVSWHPVELNVKGYELVFGQPMIWRAYWNTIKYAIVGTAITLLFTSMIAYSLMIRDFIFRKPIILILMITMFFSGGMIPSYLQIMKLGLMNTIWAVTLPGAVGAWNVFIYRTFFRSISPEMREAAFIDGAGEFSILFKIYFPLSKALFATFGLFALVGYWNMWFNAMLYIKDNLKQPVQIILRQVMNSASQIDEGTANELLTTMQINPKNVQYACIVATVWPIMAVYPFLQKHFEKGMMLGAIKG
jgi:putative aldouronate transport system permease protein